MDKSGQNKCPNFVKVTSEAILDFKGSQLICSSVISGNRTFCGEQFPVIYRYHETYSRSLERRRVEK